MITFDRELARTGGNQLGVLAFGAALVAFFLDASWGMGAIWLAAIGAVLYLSTLLKPKLSDTGAGDDNPGGS